jgi:hypothetical protein
VRIKPLGAGSGDITIEGENYNGWRYKGCNVEKNEISFGDIDPKKKQVTYNFPKFIADGEYSQQMVFDKLLEKHYQNFMNGYNVNFMTYGQTGTGKTYTLLGPMGSFKDFNGSLDPGSIPDSFGILTRLVMKVLENKGGAMLTLNAA